MARAGELLKPIPAKWMPCPFRERTAHAVSRGFQGLTRESLRFWGGGEVEEAGLTADRQVRREPQPEKNIRREAVQSLRWKGRARYRRAGERAARSKSGGGSWPSCAGIWGLGMCGRQSWGG